MKLTPFCLFLTLALPLTANEALDLLEGKDESAGWTVAPVASGGGGSGEQVEGGPGPARDWDYDRRSMRYLPPLFSVYQNDDNEFVQRVSFDGLLEWRTEDGSYEPDNAPKSDLDDTGVRRARLGARVRAFYNTDFEARAVFDDDDYQGIDSLRATVDVADGVAVSVGKYRPPFSGEYSLDPAVRVTPEIGQLSRQIAPANTLGAMVAVQAGGWDYAAGYFSGDVDKDIPDLDGDGFILGKVAYTFQGPPLSPDNAESPGSDTYQRWYLDYIYNLNRDDSSSIPLAYQHLASTGVEVSSERMDLLVDLMLANGDVNTAWGLTVLGSYWLYEDAVQIVGRYHYADTDDDNGLIVGYGIGSAIGDSTQPQTYPTTFTADELHSFYFGLNFYFFENYIILNTGIEYQLLKDDDDSALDADSWIWQAGGRIAF